MILSGRHGALAPISRSVECRASMGSLVASRGSAATTSARRAASQSAARAPRPGGAPGGGSGPFGSGCGGGAAAARRGALQVARSNLDDPDIRELLAKMAAQAPPLPVRREKLEAVIKAIDDINAGDPKTVPGDDGRPVPFRLAYSRWLTAMVEKLDPEACDELLILARGKSVESWKLAEIRRDDYAPNGGGQKMWEFDRKRWVAARLTEIMKDAGCEEQAVQLVDDVMMSRNTPNPRDMRLHDLLGPFGLINFRILLAAKVVQTLADAEALLFLDRSFDELFNRMPANEVEALARKELSGLSTAGVVAAMKLRRWSPVQEKLLSKALPKPFVFNEILRNTEGVAASSTHPGDWRFRDFDYE
ncbi:MAG: hypothetical protein J3K34DRAFT_262116 [Monoraphidium minutum]|nr:MAG: hypothetical protein J3K34DRAFT_262116 [Monoraphidium minutum]